VKVCRLIFRKTTGSLLVRVVYNSSNIPTIEEEINDFAILNGYNLEALTCIDIDETDERFQQAVDALSITLGNNDELVFETGQVPDVSDTTTTDPLSEINEKLDLLMLMQLEKGGIV
jgi:hypothetical protein